MLAINAEPRHKEYELEKDLEDMNSTAGEWVGMKKTRQEDYGHRTKVMNKNSRIHESQPRMERIMHLVAE